MVLTAGAARPVLTHAAHVTLSQQARLRAELLLLRDQACVLRLQQALLAAAHLKCLLQAVC